MTWNKDRKQTKYGHKRQEHMRHTTEPWHNSPLPEQFHRGGGVGALEAPQDKHGQEHRTGTSRAEQTDKGGHGGAGSSGGHGSAGSSGGHGVARGSGGHGSAGSSGGHSRWSMWPWPRSPRPGPYNRNPFTPPQNFPGEVRVYQEPSGARHRQTGQDIPQESLPPLRQGRVSVDKTWQDKVS